MLRKFPNKKLSVSSQTRFFLWGLMTYLLALCSMVLIIKIAFSGYGLAEKAFINGQSIRINIASGKIEGLVSNSQSVTNHKPQAAGQEIKRIISKEGLNPAPNSALVEQLDKMSLPMVAKDGTTPWRYYARPFQQKEKRPEIAIIFTNLGLSRPLTEEAIKLAHDFTLGFSPYASDAGKWSAKTRETGFESVIDLPMQPENYPLSDPGPFGLMEDLSTEENITRLYSVISALPALVGVVASGNEKMTASNEQVKPYLLELKKRGLLFIYVRNSKNRDLDELAKSLSAPVIGIDKVIDEEISRSAIETSLQNLADMAKSNGYAVGLAHSYPPTLETLAHWSDEFKKQGIDLVPVSAIGKRLYP